MAARYGNALIQDRLGQSDEAAAGYPGSAFWMRRYLVALKGGESAPRDKEDHKPRYPWPAQQLIVWRPRGIGSFAEAKAWNRDNEADEYQETGRHLPSPA